MSPCDWIIAGYAGFEGTVLQGEELSRLLQGLESNNLLGGYTHMLTVRDVYGMCCFCSNQCGMFLFFFKTVPRYPPRARGGTMLRPLEDRDQCSHS